MSGNALTILVGAIGVAASLVIGLLFYRLGERSAITERRLLADHVEDLEKTVKNLFQQMRVSLPAHIPTPQRIIEGSPRRSSTLTGATEPGDSTTADPAVVALVRASLGALQDERGDVRFPRLLQQVAGAIGTGPAAYPLVVDALRQLWAEGIVTWPGEDTDPSHAQIMSVRPSRPVMEERERTPADGGRSERQ